MKLIELLDNINQFDDDSVIFVPINSRPHEDTEAMVSRIILIDEPPGIQTPEGMKYLLEVELAKEVIQVWKDWRNGNEPSPFEKYQAVLYYAEKDAYFDEDIK
ncbi:MAG: hypothetical protein P8Z00_21795 [Anaerolineales bacterium]